MDLNSDFINIDTGCHQKIENDLNNSENDLNNSENDLNNSENDFKNSENDFKNSENDLNNSENDLNNSETKSNKKNIIYKNSTWKRFNISQKKNKIYIKQNRNLKFMLYISVFLNFYNYFSSYTVNTLI